MDLLRPVVNVILFFWAPLSRQICYLKHLKANVEALTSEMEELTDQRLEIEAEVDRAIAVGKAPTRAVELWLKDFNEIETKVDSIRSEFEQQRTCLNGCCTDHFSRYKLGKRVVKSLEDVQNLKYKGFFNEVAWSPCRPPTVLEMQPSLPRVQQSTAEETMEEIWQCLHDEENGIIGIYGMGGIGKTTLMKAINNKFVGTVGFNFVIWVTVSMDLDLGLIQEIIAKRLDISFDDNEDTTEKGDRLFTRLKNVRYLLILDDLWESFSLDQVGIPKPNMQNRCKIAITTRSLAVCSAMKADKVIRVRPLTMEEAWNLFCERSGDVVLSSEIRPIAQKVVEECGGLPLAIVTMGRAMRGTYKKEVWEYALRGLKGSSAEVPGMERHLFLPLKLSYDRLENDNIKLCFLYCSLFPEDYDIEIDELIRYWVMEEGFIENVENLEEALIKARGILERIMDACLLDEGSLGHGYVKMNHLFRDLAIQITSPSSPSLSKGSKFLVKSGKRLVQPPEERMWEGMVRISLIHNKIKHLQITPNCPDLVSLFLNDNHQLCTIHSSFFTFMPKLQILDLSNTSIESLPESLLLLVNLRALILRSCQHLVELPPLGNLKELRLLNLSRTGLKNLPQGIASLLNLKQLDLSYLWCLNASPYDMMFRLPNLEDLSMLGLDHVDGATFGKIVTMTRLHSLRISVSNLNGFIEHDMFHRWFTGLRRFHVQVGYQGYGTVECFSDKEISICGCDKFPCGIEGLIKHAVSLYFQECKGPRSLSQLVGNSTILRHLSVFGFSGVECIIDWREVRDDAFQCLQQLNLSCLPNLEKIFDGGAPPLSKCFQNLIKIKLVECPKLRCLFPSGMVEHLHQLEELHVSYCPEVVEIIEADIVPDNSFPRIRFLYLEKLPKLASISSQQFTFTSLEEIIVTSCPRLKKLPLFHSSIHEIKGEIEGEREWWDGLEWEDRNAMLLYSTIYRSA